VPRAKCHVLACHVLSANVLACHVLSAKRARLTCDVRRATCHVPRANVLGRRRARGRARVSGGSARQAREVREHLLAVGHGALGQRSG